MDELREMRADEAPESPIVDLPWNSLSNEAVYALSYCRAVLLGGEAKTSFVTMQEQTRISPREHRKALQIGLDELVRAGAITLVKNGLGEWEPAQIHCRIVQSSTLVTKDMV